MDLERQQLLRQLMALDFYLVDLNLYLDTHPMDQRALMLFNSTMLNARVIREEYEKLYGPLTTFNGTSTDSWRWIESPWPWENK